MISSRRVPLRVSLLTRFSIDFRSGVFDQLMMLIKEGQCDRAVAAVRPPDGLIIGCSRNRRLSAGADRSADSVRLGAGNGHDILVTVCHVECGSQSPVAGRGTGCPVCGSVALVPSAHS